MPTAFHHGLDGNADAPQPAHTPDPQCPRLVVRLAMPIKIERMRA
jgi:hypothetical protein